MSRDSVFRGLVGLVAAIGVSALLASSAGAADDHLKCYKVKDTVNSKAIVNLATQQFGTASGCKVKVKAALLCTPVTKTVVTSNAPGATYNGQTLTDDRLCYKVKCPKVALPNRNVLDQFGLRSIGKFSTKLVCTPADIL